MKSIKRAPLWGAIRNTLIIIFIATIIAYAIYANTTKETEISNPIQTEESKAEEKVTVEEKDIHEEPKEEIKTEIPQEKVEIPEVTNPTPTPTPQPKPVSTPAPAPAPKNPEPVQTMGNYTNLGNFKITAYCSCRTCCGQWSGGPTASGVMPQAGRTIAVDPRVIPLGSKVMIDGCTYVAEDTGGAIKGNRIDLYFSSHAEALNWGVRYKNVSIVN